MNAIDILKIHKRGCSNCGSFLGPYRFYTHAKIRLCPPCAGVADAAWDRVSALNDRIRAALDRGDTDGADRLRAGERMYMREYYAAVKDFVGMRDEPVATHIGESAVDRAVTRDAAGFIADLTLRGWERVGESDTLVWFRPPSYPCTNKRCPRCKRTHLSASAT